MQKLIANPKRMSKLSLLEQAKVTSYLEDPVAFVKNELNEEPSPDQIELLKQVANLDNLFFIICAGRGSGKTRVVSWIASWSAAILSNFYPQYDIAVLGGSRDQSEKLYKYVGADVYKTKLLEKKLTEPPLKSYTTMDGCEITTHAASETSVRGGHVEMLILDECAEISAEIIASVLPMVSGAKHGRIIMLSTPHKMYGDFQDVWENFESYNFKRHGPWSLENCAWQRPELLQLLKRKYTPEQYAVEVMGQFPILGDKMFRREWIEGAIAPKPFTYNDRYDVEIGLDWGFSPSPCAMVQIQRYNGMWQIPGPEKTWLGIDAVTISNELKEYKRTHRLLNIYADSSHRHMNEHLRKTGIHTEDVFFSIDKELMQINLQYMLSIGAISISPDCTQLIEQLKQYRVEPVRKRLGKKEEDLVDALMMACKQAADEDLKDAIEESKMAKQFQLR